MGNAQRDIQRNFAMKRYRTRIVILFIDNLKSLKNNGERSNAKGYGWTIDGSFHTVHTFLNVTMLISTSKSARAQCVQIPFQICLQEGRLELYKVKSTKFKISSAHVIYLFPKQLGTSL